MAFAARTRGAGGKPPPPRSRRFGDAAVVADYNCPTRALQGLADRISGILLLTYFDDYGAMAPLTVGRWIMRHLPNFATCSA